MDTQTTIRLPRQLASALEALAEERGVPKSQLIREALERYLSSNVEPTRVMMVRERSAPYIGSLNLQASAGDADDISALIRERNWRE